jgi:hypothetical protein
MVDTMLDYIFCDKSDNPNYTRLETEWYQPSKEPTAIDLSIISAMFND